MNYPMSSRIRSQVGVACVGASALMSALIASPAYAVETESREALKSCWVDLDTTKSLCVDRREALADAALAEHGVLLESEDGSIAPSALALSNFRRDGMQPLSGTVIGILYEHRDYGGAVLVVTHSQGCSGNAYGYTGLGQFGWNDRLSSFQSFSNCRTTIYEHDGYNGSQYTDVDTGYVGDAMNDRASSVMWY